MDEYRRGIEATAEEIRDIALRLNTQGLADDDELKLRVCDELHGQANKLMQHRWKRGARVGATAQETHMATKTASGEERRINTYFNGMVMIDQDNVLFCFAGPVLWTGQSLDTVRKFEGAIAGAVGVMNGVVEMTPVEG